MRCRELSTSARIVLFLLKIFYPVLRLIGFAFKVFYKVFFSWWVSPLIDRRIRDSFAEEIRHAMPQLFERYGGKIVSDPKPKGNDPNQIYLCLSAGNVVLKFSKWHSEYHQIRIAPQFAPADFFDLLDVIRLTDPVATIDAKKLDVSWRAFGELLLPRFEMIESTFAPEHFSETRVALTRAQ